MNPRKNPYIDKEATMLAQQVVIDLDNQRYSRNLNIGGDQRMGTTRDLNDSSSYLTSKSNSIDSPNSSIDMLPDDNNDYDYGNYNYQSTKYAQKNVSRDYGGDSNDDLPENDTNFFDMRLWRRMSKQLPNSVRDPLDFKMLENEEKLRRTKMKQMNHSDSKKNSHITDHSFPQHSFKEQNDHTSQKNPYHFDSEHPSLEIQDDKEMLPEEKENLFGSSVPGGLSHQDWMYLQDHNLRSGGLPTLEQVLNRKTFAPLSLRDFAVHCSVRQPEARKWLEFYMAAVTHEKMCLSYLSSKHIYNSKTRKNSNHNELGSRKLKSGKSKKKNNQTYSDALNQKAAREAVQIQSATESIFLRYFRAALIPNNNRGNDPDNGGYDEWPLNSWSGGNQFNPTDYGLDSSNHYGQKRYSKMFSNFGGLRRIMKQPIEIFSNALILGGKSPYGTFTKSGQDPSTRVIHMSSENQYSTKGYRNSAAKQSKGGFKRQTIYYMPWPPEILSKIELQLSRGNAVLDPHLFSEAIMYAYEILNVYYYSIFLQEATTRNCSHGHSVFRILFGILLLLSFGFTYPISLILLNHNSKIQRLWCLIPQLLGWWNIFVGFSGCDMLFSLVKRYQSPSPNYLVSGTSYRNMWFSTRESVDVTSTEMVKRRSIKMFIFAIAMGSICVLILCLVPGISIFN
ncbi:hypothetical protein BB559_002426 [Furculomyces boomerangus]|uniref:RGS domain-containing protein n=2 Tax=Harpellales TaxID=61421 RepID=A0A2T9YVB5_9FUNG|nr:hypothetical protein BB559_002426 [Furculomyces boomerangus]PVZ99312.1 hypothetical protein BB558_004694 [Smittium angustum]